MTGLPRIPICSNRMAGMSTDAREKLRPKDIPFKDVDCREGHSVRENHSGDDEQNELKLCNWKYSTIKCQPEGGQR